MGDWADTKVIEWRELEEKGDDEADDVSLAALLREVAHATRMEAVKAATQMMGEQDDNAGQIWDRSAAVMKTDLLAEVRRVVEGLRAECSPEHAYPDVNACWACDEILARLDKL